MKFKIIATDGSVQIYDNMTNEVLVPSGHELIANRLKDQIETRRQDKPIQPFDFTDDIYPFPKKSKTVYKLRIFIGSNCNFKCSYCVQHGSKFNSPVVGKRGIDNFFKLLDDIDISLTDNAKIELQGGEPLVYQKSLKILLPKLRERYPDANISMVSNGSLISKEMVDFFIKYRLNLTFSHDAQAYFLRGKDPLDDPKMLEMQRYVFERYAQADNVSFNINVVISQYNCNLQKIEEFFKEKLPGVCFGFEGVVMAHTSNAVQFCSWDNASQDQLFRSICYAFFEDPNSKVCKALTDRVMTFVKRIVNKVPANCIHGRCDVMKENALVVDLLGNVLSCHNVDPATQYIGKLNDWNGIKADKFKHWSLRRDCPSCPFISGCSGSCVRDNDIQHHAGCIVQRMFFGQLFYVAQKLLTNTEIAEIVPLSNPKLTLVSAK